MRTKVIEAIEKEKIIVIVRGVEREKLLPLCQAMYDGGIRLLEITYDASGKITDAQTAENISMLAQAFSDRMYIGAGTVLKPEQVELTKAAGGKFIISPDTKEAVIAKTVELGLVSMPGAFTPSEVALADAYGADFVKLFPVNTLGPDYVKAIKAPLSHIRMLAVGGIDETNMGEYLKAGISGFGVGTNIVDKKRIAAGAYEEISELAKKYVAALV